MTPESFAAFYSAYPRKVARKSAEKAWARIATSEALIEQIMAGLRRHKADWGILNPKAMKFIPYPATWLNQRRWEDEITPICEPRVIVCEKCGDSGVVQVPSKRSDMHFERCSCRTGQLPGVLAGVEESA